jgi:flagellar biosynthesis GTPase FlhF
MPSVENGPRVFRATTLKEAYRKVKMILGDQAVILGSRKVTQRQNMGLGQEHLIEVLAAPPGTPGGPLVWPEHGHSEAPRPAAQQAHGGSIDSAAELERSLELEVERIEELVRAIGDEVQSSQKRSALLQANPLAETLMESGVQTETMEKLLTRFTSETGKSPQDRVEALNWITDNLRASNCEWEGFYGCHAFLGMPGSGRTSLVLEVAARLKTLGRKTLVLMVMPEDSSEVRRLQTAASKLGFDGAVIQKPGQLTRSAHHLERYEAVLVDMPALNSRDMAPGAALHSWLAGNASFHRHLVLPLDGDPGELPSLVATARDWQMDWLAVSRCDLSAQAGKILEFQDRLPLPYSLLSQRGDNGGNEIEIASSDSLVDRMLGTGSRPASRALAEVGS